jgi:hypothetical protein
MTTATLAAGCAIAAEAAAPTPTPNAAAPAPAINPPANAALVAHARAEFCTNVTELYSTIMAMKFGAAKPELTINGTVQRHETLSRLLIMAWAQGCDFGPLFNLEREKINGVLNAAPLSPN